MSAISGRSPISPVGCSCGWGLAPPQYVGWQTAMLVLPVVYRIYCSYYL